MYLLFLLSALAFKSRHQIQHQLARLGFKRVYKTEMYTVSCATSSLLPRRRATSSRRKGFGRCSPSTTSTTPRTSPFPNPRGPLVSVSSRSGHIRKLLPQLHVCVFRLVTMVRMWCTRSLGRLNFLDLLLRHNALVGGHPGPRKKADEHSSTR